MIFFFRKISNHSSKGNEIWEDINSLSHIMGLQSENSAINICSYKRLLARFKKLCFWAFLNYTPFSDFRPLCTISRAKILKNARILRIDLNHFWLEKCPWMIPPFLDGRNDGTSITWEQSFGYSVSVQNPSILKKCSLEKYTSLKLSNFQANRIVQNWIIRLKLVQDLQLSSNQKIRFLILFRQILIYFLKKLVGN